ncbi:hypothetical protein JCM11641_003642 [Rhodosporidiobolus odoratus]
MTHDSPQRDDSTSTTPSAQPSPLATHLAKFRYASPSPSPTSSVRRSPRKHSPVKQVITARAQLPSLQLRSPPKPKPTKRIATPPRSDGSSRHFKQSLTQGLSSDTEAEQDDYEPKEGETGSGRGGGGGGGGGSAKKKRKRPPRPYADASVYAHLGDDPLEDYMMYDAKLFLCGINPGKQSAEKGLHFANPTNHYWRCLASSGLTDRLLHPSEGKLLSTDYGICATNLVSRPSAEMSEISKEEMKASVPKLLQKVVEYRPTFVAFVGMKICEVVLRYLHNLPRPAVDAAGSPSKRRPAMPKVKIGLQPVTISLPPPAGEQDGDRRKVYVWCLPSTSARVVEYQLVDKIKIFTSMREDIDRVCANPPEPLNLPSHTVDHPSELLFPALEQDVKVEDEAGTVEKGSWSVTMVKAEDVEPKNEVKDELVN